MSEKKAILSLGTMIILLSVVAFSVKASSVESVEVSPLTEQMLVFNLQTGQKFTGSLSISGSSGNDINFWITDPQGTTILNLGTVSQGTSFDFTPQASGAYTFYFDNSFPLRTGRLLSSKTVRLTYDIGLPSINGSDIRQLLITIIVAVILLIVIVALAVALSHKKRTSRTNQNTKQKEGVKNTTSRSFNPTMMLT
jgi:hypothetical protein